MQCDRNYVEDEKFMLNAESENGKLNKHYRRLKK